MDFLIVSQAESGSSERQASLLADDLLTQLDQLAEKWRDHSVADLRLRHETGAVLNAHFGNPTERLEYGEGVVEELAQRLRIEKSDISRMRRFAHHFESVEDLGVKHHDVTTWSDVRKLLPKLRAKSKEDGQLAGETSSRSSRSKSAKVRGLKLSLKHLSDSLRTVREDLSKKEREELLAKFQELAEAVSDCLRVRVSLEPAEGNETQPPSERKVTAEAGTAAKA